jgi:hypothetical protein
MTSILAFSGIVAWTFVGLLVVALVAARLFSRALHSRRMYEPSALPYRLWLDYRYKGLLMTLGRRLGWRWAVKLRPAVVEAHQTVSLDAMKQLRDVMLEVDTLPTVVAGKQALGLNSVFDLPLKKVTKIQSPYTHPLQYPPHYIPGVPARTFYDSAEFEWAKPLRDAFPEIRRELMGVLHNNGAGFKAYMTETDQRLAGWNTFNFFFYGKKVEENCARCPVTTATLESLPRFERDHIMFSALNPHSHIPPHTGPMNGIIRAHLGLVVPDGCYIRVGRDERTWKEGELLIFDDSFEHEVWNHSDQVRIVLFINFWHTCFKREELPVLERFRSAYELSPLSKVHEENQGRKRDHDLAKPAVAVPA